MSAPDDAAGIAAATAEDRSPADDDRRHRRQQVDIGQAHVGRIGAPDDHEPSDGREQTAQDVVGQQHLPDPHAGQLAGLAIVADRIEQAAEAGAAEPDQHHERDRRPQEEVDGNAAQHFAAAKRLDERWHARRVGQHLLAVDDQCSLGHQPGAKRHDQRLHPQHCDADAVDQSDGKTN